MATKPRSNQLNELIGVRLSPVSLGLDKLRNLSTRSVPALGRNYRMLDPGRAHHRPEQQRPQVAAPTL